MNINHYEINQMEKRFINRFSLGPLAWPLYSIFRRQYWIFFGFLGLTILLNKRIFDKIFYLDLYYYFIAIRILLYIVYMFFGRRLSWKSCNWSDTEAFKKSEKRWIYFGAFFILVFIVSIYYFYSYYLYSHRFFVP